MKVQKSSWVIKAVYFDAEVVDNFAKKYLEWFANDGSEVEDSTIQFANRIENEKVIKIYQFPFEKDTDETADYFEKEDDNHVIPYHLFK